MEPFATVEEYEARYGEVDDPERVATRLLDASSYVMAQPGLRLLEVGDPGYDVQQMNLARVTCAVVHRSLSAGDLAGYSQYTQTAVNYSVTVSPANAGEDFYLTKQDLRSLGIGAGRIGQTDPYGRGRHGPL